MVTAIVAGDGSESGAHIAASPRHRASAPICRYALAERFGIGQPCAMTHERDSQPLEARIDADGWNSLHPKWRERIDANSGLALTIEALRRAVELRDVLAESGSKQTVRALMLVAVLNELYPAMVRDRVGPEAEVPHGRMTEIVESLHDRGIMSRAEYSSVLPGDA
jgi:hypothetical protein